MERERCRIVQILKT